MQRQSPAGGNQMIKRTKMISLAVAGLMTLSVIGTALSAPVYALQPTTPGKSDVAHNKKNPVVDPIEIVVTDETTTPAVDNGLQNKPAETPATPEKAESKVAPKETQGNEDKVTICHRTNSATNPYVVITVDSNAVDGVAGSHSDHADHFGEHKGPIASSLEVAQDLKSDKVEWGDIIPPVAPYHEGQNYTAEGKAMLENGCNFAKITPADNPDDEGEVLSGNPDGGKGEVLPAQLPNTGTGSPAFILMMIAALAALAGLGGSIVRLVLKRGMSLQ